MKRPGGADNQVVMGGSPPPSTVNNSFGYPDGTPEPTPKNRSPRRGDRKSPKSIEDQTSPQDSLLAKGSATSTQSPAKPSVAQPPMVSADQHELHTQSPLVARAQLSGEEPVKVAVEKHPVIDVTTAIAHRKTEQALSSATQILLTAIDITDRKKYDGTREEWREFDPYESSTTAQKKEISVSYYNSIVRCQPAILENQAAFEACLQNKIPLRRKTLPDSIRITPNTKLNEVEAEGRVHPPILSFQQPWYEAGVIWDDNAAFIFEVHLDNLEKIDIHTTPAALYEEFLALLRQRYPAHHSVIIEKLEAEIKVGEKSIHRPMGEKLFLLLQFVERTPQETPCPERQALRQALYNQHRRKLTQDKPAEDHSAQLSQLRQRFLLPKQDLCSQKFAPKNITERNLAAAFLSTIHPEEKEWVIQKARESRQTCPSLNWKPAKTSDEKVISAASFQLVKAGVIKEVQNSSENTPKKITQKVFQQLYDAALLRHTPLDLSNLDLTGIDFTQAGYNDFTGAIFDGAILENAIFSFNVDAGKNKTRAMGCIVDGCSFKNVKGNTIKIKMGDKQTDFDVITLDNTLDQEYRTRYQKKWRKTAHAIDAINTSVSENNASLEKLLRKMQHADQVISRAHFWNNCTTHEALCAVLGSLQTQNLSHTM
ncbi:MAG: hypothetical protein A3E84_03105 [Gammaproteobacteria bacterium RIFCSPHIGHO2_12_FULL_42_13]|nr:MAG: hypothetical protein A3E84_03105 [Gammaproteobacteria bacterium RIFCSPHIGHO2_12_FULL_42_13]